MKVKTTHVTSSASQKQTYDIYNIKLGKKYLILKLYNHQVHRVSTTVIQLASAASAFGSSALLPFSAGLAFFCLGALLTVFFLGSGAGGLGLHARRAEHLRSLQAATFALPMLVAGNAGKKSEKNITVDTERFQDYTRQPASCGVKWRM